MKTLLTLVFGVVFIASSADQTVPRHNVFFAWNSPDINRSSAAVVEAVYAKLPAGQQIRFGIEGPISSVHGTAERNRIISERANNIVALLKRIGSENDVIEIVDVTEPYLKKPQERTASTPFQLEVLVTKAAGPIRSSFRSIDDYLPLPVQSFTINPREDNRLVGALGTVITIPAYTLELKNGSVPSEMNVELKEVYGAALWVQANLHTASGGRMLRSGGSIHVDASTNGKPAQVASGKKLDLEFPLGDDDRFDDMQTFYGRTDRNGNFDWTLKGAANQRQSETREEFYINDIKVSKEEYYERIQAWEDRKAEQERQEEIEKQVASNEQAMDAYLLQSDELGWINCDAFYDVEEKTDVIVFVDTTYRPSVRMVFDNINSVLAGDYNQRNGTVTFRDVPVGETVRLVGFSIMDDVPYIATVSAQVSANLKKDLKLVQTTKNQMEAELASLK